MDTVVKRYRAGISRGGHRRLSDFWRQQEAFRDALIQEREWTSNRDRRKVRLHDQLKELTTLRQDPKYGPYDLRAQRLFYTVEKAFTNSLTKWAAGEQAEVPRRAKRVRSFRLSRPTVRQLKQGRALRVKGIGSFRCKDALPAEQVKLSLGLIPRR